MRNESAKNTAMNIRLLTAVPVAAVSIDDAFWSPRVEIMRTVTVNDAFTKFENDRGGAFKNFDRVAGDDPGYHAGPEWYDGLLYEMIRASADFLAVHYNRDLDARLDGYIERIAAAAAMDPNGYINTWTQLMAPTQRWGLNGGFLLGQHDVYNAGALVEAGIHHYQATKKISLLSVAVKFANHMCNLMGPPPKKNIVPAHSLPEESLVKLYLLFRDHPEIKSVLAVPVIEAEYLRLAEFWIENRGNNTGKPDWETDDHLTCLKYIRSQEYGEGRPSWGAYAQDHKPVLEQESLEGHAVRATLLCTGLIAAASVNKRADYFQAALRLWESMVYRRMHLTGGVGAVHKQEKFGPDYFLPNDAYLETCAAVGAGFFHQGMSLAFADSRYADELERVMYNGILNGISFSGDAYYYQNPLQSHAKNRWRWHECPCCPPMLLKFAGALPGYIYAHDQKNIYINQYIGSTAEINLPDRKIYIQQKSGFPWQGKVSLALKLEQPKEFTLFLRIPGWARGIENPGLLYTCTGNQQHQFRVTVNDMNMDSLPVEQGYAAIQKVWKNGDKIELEIPMLVRRIYARSEVEADRGRVALGRGPLIYCLESADNPYPLDLYRLKPNDVLTADYDPLQLKGVTLINAQAWRAESSGLRPAKLKAIPFFAQNNRIRDTDVIVWLREER